jgi:menaquinone-dependent protoporphyrinogen oxidase
MPAILVLYASKHGHTAKVAARIAAAAEAAGAKVDLHDAGVPGRADPARYDAVVVGASIHAGRHQGEVVDWARVHHAALDRMPSAFFSVSLTAAEDSEEARLATRRYVDEFREATGWSPDRTETVAGALQYREYDFMTRLLIRLIVRKKEGHPTDTSHDYDYTDWGAVERFGRECAELAATAAAAR